MPKGDDSNAEHLQGPMGRALVWFTSTRIGQLIYVRAVPPIDRRMMLKSDGQKSLSPHGDPDGPGGLALLTTIGAKTGKERHTPLGYARDGDNIVILASNAARSYHPDWYWNLTKTPAVTIRLGGGPQGRYRAEEVPDGPERDRLWKVMTALNPGFDEYPARTKGRLIPVINCTPIEG